MAGDRGRLRFGVVAAPDGAVGRRKPSHDAVGAHVTAPWYWSTAAGLQTAPVPSPSEVRVHEMLSNSEYRPSPLPATVDT